MECLKLYHDLSLFSTRIPVPFLTHFFSHFDPQKSKALASSIANFHLRDLESADYRSAYHMLCDWFYGWNVTDATAETGTEHFRMRRVPREIDVREEGERVECDRICKTYETLFGLSRRVLKRYYLDIEELVPKIGLGASDISARDDRVRDEGDGMDNVERVWAQQRKRENEHDEETKSENGSADSLDKEMEELLRMSRPAGMVVRRKTQSYSTTVLERGVRGVEGSVWEQDEEGEQGEHLSKTENMPSTSATTTITTADSTTMATATERSRPSSGTLEGSQPPDAPSSPNSIRKGTLHEAPGQDDIRRSLQRDINQIYVQLDRATDYTLVCLSTAFCVLTFSQVLGHQDTFLKYASFTQELSMDFVSNTLKTVWDLLHRELPPTDLSLQDLRNPDLLKLKIQKVVALRTSQHGKTPKYRWRKLYRKFALLHELFTSVDVHLFPNFLVAHREGVKAAKFSSFDSCLWLTGGYDCVIRIHDIRPQMVPTTPATPTSIPPVSVPGPAGGTTGHTCLSQYIGHKSIITDVHFTHDDTHIISSSFDRTLKIWNAQSASCERTLTGHTDSVTTCDISSDGRYIASGSTDCTIRLWDFHTGENLTVIRKHSRWIKVVRFSHDGRYLLTAGLDKKIYVWDVKILIHSRAISHTRCIEVHTDYVLDMATTRPSLVASTSRDCTVRINDFVSGQEIAVFDLAPSWACSVCFSENGEYLATGSFDNNVSIYRVGECTRVRQIRVLNLGILCVRFPKDLGYVVVGSLEGFLQQVPL
ncbi:hypothetical protein SpCBS45565_g03102 [Spizellomyces sp. 'palustris']|nr:hypothetical protein SpCBS45565_g03102 [Spizellomyces sp. 'palustris']